MSALPTVASLWIGGSLTWLEQLCLKSFVDHGHPTVLYTYGEVQGVPEGVVVKDGREVVDTDAFVTHAKSESVALFSDLFRFHMIKKIPGIIWIDTDIYCHRPIDFEDPRLYGFEVDEPGLGGRVNGAVLRLPESSELLHVMLDFMEEEYPDPQWLRPRRRAEIAARRAAGNPMHVSEMQWGIWGPLGISAFLRQTGEIKYAKSYDVFYPVVFKKRFILFRDSAKVDPLITDDTHTIRLWAPIKRLAARDHDGLCPPGTFMDGLLRRHGIDATAAPIRHTEKREVVD